METLLSKIREKRPKERKVERKQNNLEEEDKQSLDSLVASIKMKGKNKKK